MPSSLDRSFLRFSIDRLNLFASRINDCLARLNQEQIWARAGENQNAIGNLVLHLCGNVRQWIVSGVGGARDVRQRDAEFAARATLDARELAQLLSATLAEAIAVLENLPATRLADQLVIQGYEVTGLEAIYSVVEHFSGHTGQIIFATKLCTGEDLGYYAHLSKRALMSFEPISRRSVLKGLAAAPLAQKPAKRPNVLFVAADDLNERLGCYGFPVKSPNVDALAGRGVRFERAYCNYPLCNPSRASLLTGKRPPSTRIWENNTWFRRRLPDVVTLPQYFRQNGYVTAMSGKIFHDGLNDDRAWDFGGTPVAEGGVRRPAGDVKERQARSDRWVAVPGDGQDQGDYKVASSAIELLARFKSRQPFFLAMGFHKPHAPFIAPKKYFDLYGPASITLPADFAPEPTGNSPSIRSNWDLFSVRKANAELAREAIAAYYACISFIDAQLGRVLEALDRSGQRDNTVIVFFGDNGWHLGQKGLWGKTTLFEPSCRDPLIISAPGVSPAGRASGRVVEFVDIFPTLVDLCGLPRAVTAQSIRCLE